jgi:ERCC4-type nuclease
MNQVILKFDNREKHLIEIFYSLYPSIPFSIEPLCIGDIHFSVDGHVRCMIERKTLDDLSASIIDHRWSEQKVRMSGIEQCNKGYIIEGLTKSNSRGIPHNTLISTMISAFIKDEMFVFRTYDIQETALSIKLIYDKLCNQSFHVSETCPIVNQLTGNKKHMYTKDNIWTAQVACIPGISFNIAKKITSEYKSFVFLYEAYLKHDKTTTFLSAIPKIGKKLSTIIGEYMF